MPDRTAAGTQGVDGIPSPTGLVKGPPPSTRASSAWVLGSPERPRVPAATRLRILAPVVGTAALCPGGDREASSCSRASTSDISAALLPQLRPGKPEARAARRLRSRRLRSRWLPAGHGRHGTRLAVVSYSPPRLYEGEHVPWLVIVCSCRMLMDMPRQCVCFGSYHQFLF